MNESAKKNSNAKIRAVNRYNKKTYSRTTISLKHSEMEILDKHCEKFNHSKNGFIVKSIKQNIENESGKTFEELLKETEQSKSSD